MKYLVSILVGALIIGGALTACVHWLMGPDVAQFVARFVAGPVGLAAAFVAFIVYDSLWPKRK